MSQRTSKSGRSPLSCQLGLLDVENTIFKNKNKTKKNLAFFRHLKGLVLDPSGF
jgi:hypothetical protein